jgi:hypothetical protein
MRRLRPTPPVPRSAFAVPTSADRPPSLSAAQIDAILAAYHSPAAGLGSVFYDLGVQYRIDPAFAVAFFVVESACGTRGVARTTHSVGNIRRTPGYACLAGYRATRSGNAERGTRGRAPLAAASRPTSAFRVPPSADPAAYAASVIQLVDSWSR